MIAPTTVSSFIAPGRASWPILSARDTNSTAISSVVYQADGGLFAFAATAVKENGDFYFHLEAPARYQWVAVGAGHRMADSLIWIAYRSKDGKGKPMIKNS